MALTVENHGGYARQILDHNLLRQTVCGPNFGPTRGFLKGVWSRFSSIFFWKKRTIFYFLEFFRFLQLNQDFFTSGGITQSTKKLLFCYYHSYGLIEMLLPWPYRVPNQELTIINSIFYNLMQRRVLSSIFCLSNGSTIRNFDCYLSRT